MNAHPIIVSGDIHDSLNNALGEYGEIEIRGENLLLINSRHFLPKDELIALRSTHRVDINQLPKSFDPREVGLVISDMDSTFISIECIDEIADFANIKTQISAITEAAMRGEIDFETSLTRRVGLLAGLDTSALEKVYRERVKLNPGAAKLVEGLHQQRIPFALVSGGFTFFTERLKDKYRLDFTKSNTLKIVDDKLTGNILGGIVGAQAKADYLEELCQTLAIAPHQTIAMGDGANDLLMMEKAGLSVGYRAKPVIQEKADIVINYSGLDLVLELIS